MSHSELPETQSLPLLRRELTALRHALGEQRDRILTPQRTIIRLDLASTTSGLASLDTARFEEAARFKHDPHKLDLALNLYTGPFMEGFQDEWVLFERERLSQIHFSVLQNRANLALEEKQYDLATSLLKRSVALAPYEQQITRQLMVALAQSGQDAEVIAVYERLCQRLKQYIAADPDRETRDLFRRLRQEARSLPKQNPDSLAVPESTPAENPNLASAVVLPSLPLFLTRFFGREREMARVRTKLTLPLESESHRLVTLTGPGGTGKTRFAVELARQFQQENDNSFVGGILYVSLADVQNGPQLPDALVRQLGIDLPSVRKAPLDAVINALRSHAQGKHRILLILDNFEQLIAEISDDAEEALLVVTTLLSSVPELWCLVTSRQALRVSGEREFPLEPLPVPEETAESPIEIASVSLFLDRAQSARPDFVLSTGSGGNLGSVAELCRRVEGLPLALEMAAAWSRVLSPDQILERFVNPLNLQTTDRQITPRHRSMRATLEWSYGLLSAPLQEFLTSLAVFRGSFSLLAVENIFGPVALEQLAELSERSLVVVEGNPDEPPRYRLLEVVREFALENLQGSDNWHPMTQRHADFYSELVLIANEGFRSQKKPQGAYRGMSWERVVEQDYSNIQAALDTIAANGDTEKLSHMCGRLYWFWQRRSTKRETIFQSERALSLTEGKPLTFAVANLLIRCGMIYTYEGRYEEAERRVEKAFLFFEAQEDSQDKFVGLYRFYTFMCQLNKCKQDLKLFEDSAICGLEMARKSGREDLINEALGTYVMSLTERGHHEKAQQILSEQIATAKSQEHVNNLGRLLNLQAMSYFSSHDYIRTKATAKEAIVVLRQRGAQIDLSASLYYLGCCLLREGNLQEAGAALGEALDITMRNGVRLYVPHLIELLASHATASGEPCRAVYLYAAAEAARHTLSSSIELPDPKEIEAAYNACSKIDPVLARHQRSLGLATSLEDAVAMALQQASSPIQS